MSGGGSNTALYVVIVVAIVAIICFALAVAYYVSARRREAQVLARTGVVMRPDMAGLKWGLKSRHSLWSGRSSMRRDRPSMAAKWNSTSSLRVLIRSGPLGQVYTYRELQEATSNFSALNIIGEGGFGSVYKAVLADGRMGAVKRLDRTGRQGEHEFRVEVDMLTRLSSPYLVSLMGYCADQDHRLLVYEFMSNGSVQDHLHPEDSGGFFEALDWPARTQVALDAAQGLEFLHEISRPPVIHRDFKSSNILLDENYCAKVSDFGLARQGNQEGTHVSTRVLGTHGYVAPEYALTGHLTTKSDVYSFGVVLLELITGRQPVDTKRPAGEVVLVQWARPRLSDRKKLVNEVVDPSLKGQYAVKELAQMAAIAAMCVQPEAEYRPLMTDVVQSILPLVKNQRQGPAVPEKKRASMGQSGLKHVQVPLVDPSKNEQPAPLPKVMDLRTPEVGPVMATWDAPAGPQEPVAGRREIEIVSEVETARPQPELGSRTMVTSQIEGVSAFYSGAQLHVGHVEKSRGHGSPVSRSGRAESNNSSGDDLVGLPDVPQIQMQHPVQSS